MGSCEYTQVFADAGIGVLGYDKNTWKPLLRQSIICLGVCCVYFMLGMSLGAPTVILAQIRKDVNSTEIVTDEMLSWLTSSIMISSVPFVILLPLLSNKIGRKRTYLFVWLSSATGFLIFYNSTNLYYIVLSEIFAGVTSASGMTIGPLLVAEYTSPKYRGIFLTLKSASAFWGIWVSNAVGTFFPWKNIAIVPLVCSVYMISMLLWPESPYWLAMKGRYVKSANTHRWLKGVNENSEIELAQLIISQKANRNSLPLSNNICHYVRNIWPVVKSHPFYKPVLLSYTLFVQYQVTGKFIISLYAVDVLKRLTRDESFVYIEMLILDGITVFSMYVGCVLSRYYKRRTLLLLFAVTGISLLYILSLYTYLVSLSVLNENHFILLILLTTFSISIGCGPMILPSSIFGEIIPIRYERIALIFVGLASSVTVSLLLTLSPYMFSTLKMHGCFLFFAICSTIFLAINYIYLPETKDKTIQEIEEYFAETKQSVKPNINRSTTRKLIR